MIKKILLENFKAFKNAEIEIKPITVIVGPNSGGKTSLLQSICLIQQTLRGNLDAKKPVDFGNFDSVLYQNAAIKEIRLKFDFDDETYFDVTICINKKDSLNIKNFSSNIGKYEYKVEDLKEIPDEKNAYSPRKFLFKLKEDIEYDKYFNSNATPTFYRDKFFIIPSIHQRKFKDLIEDVFDDVFDDGKLINSSQNNDDSRVNDRKEKIRLAQTYMSLEKYSRDFYRDIMQKFEKIAYIGPIRETAKRLYQINHFDNIGYKGENTASIIKENEILQEKLIEAIRKLAIANSLKISQDINNFFELNIETNITNQTVNFADVGCGTSQIIPILVQLLLSEKNQMIIIEQPETHLHPKVQADFANFIVDSIKDEKKFLIETHSEYFVERIRTCIMKNPNLANDVIIYYVEQNKEEKQSVITPITINSEGQYSDLPDGYLTNYRLKEIDEQMDLMYKNLMDKVN